MNGQAVLLKRYMLEMYKTISVIYKTDFNKETFVFKTK